MKLLRLQSVILVLVCVLGISGCAPKKPVRTTVPQQPMTTAPEPTPTPEPSPTPQPAEAQPTQPAATPPDQ
ncbi:MAG TPA: hypothetical protein VKU42_09700, partial [Candidatus Angelobacter sp.]|nr:hypothetical protein [Candidatus Angelobacter sp.]